MKRIKTSLLVLTAIAIIACCTTSCRKDKEENNEVKKTIIGTDCVVPAFCFYDENHVLSGIDIDLFKAIAANQNIDFSFSIITFTEILPSLSENKIDGAIASITINEERLKNYDASDPYLTAGVVLGVSNNNQTINSLTDLDGKTVGVMDKTLSFNVADTLKEKYNFTLLTYPSIEARNEAVVNGEIDALMEGSAILGYDIYKGLPVHIVGDYLMSVDIAFFVNKGKNVELLKKFNQGLAALKANGEYETILQRYGN